MRQRCYYSFGPGGGCSCGSCADDGFVSNILTSRLIPSWAGDDFWSAMGCCKPLFFFFHINRLNSIATDPKIVGLGWQASSIAFSNLACDFSLSIVGSFDFSKFIVGLKKE